MGRERRESEYCMGGALERERRLPSVLVGKERDLHCTIADVPVPIEKEEEEIETITQCSSPLSEPSHPTHLRR